MSSSTTAIRMAEIMFKERYCLEGDLVNCSSSSLVRYTDAVLTPDCTPCGTSGAAGKPAGSPTCPGTVSLSRSRHPDHRLCEAIGSGSPPSPHRCPHSRARRASSLSSDVARVRVDFVQFPLFNISIRSASRLVAEHSGTRDFRLVGRENEGG